jgi:hypothetical protein
MHAWPCSARATVGRYRQQPIHLTTNCVRRCCARSRSCHLKRLDDDDEVVDIPAERFLAIVAEGTPTADAEAVAQDGIHNIDVLHPESAALATVQIVLPPKRYTDLLSLLKLDGQWKIINKVRKRRERETARAERLAWLNLQRRTVHVATDCPEQDRQRETATESPDGC